MYVIQRLWLKCFSFALLETEASTTKENVRVKPYRQRDIVKKLFRRTALAIAVNLFMVFRG